MAEPGPEKPVEEPAGPIDPEGQRAWLAQLERRLGTRTYAGAAALVLTLAAAIVALVMAIDSRENSATQEQVRGIERQLGLVAEDAGAFDDVQGEVETLSGELDALEQQVEQFSGVERSIEDRLEVIEDDIEALRRQISDLDNGGNGN